MRFSVLIAAALLLNGCTVWTDMVEVKPAEPPYQPPQIGAPPLQTTMSTAPYAPTNIAPPQNPLPTPPTTVGEIWNASQVQYFKQAQQSIEDLHNKRLLSDAEYLAKMRLLTERYGPQ